MRDEESHWDRGDGHVACGATGPQVLGTDDQAHALVVVRVPLQQLLHQAYGFGPFPVQSRVPTRTLRTNGRLSSLIHSIRPSNGWQGPCC